MDYYDNYADEIIRYSQVSSEGRYLNPDDINVPAGYRIEVFAQGLNYPVDMVFEDNGDLLIAEYGYMNEESKILRLSRGVLAVVADNFNKPVTGINYYHGEIYVSHKCFVTKISEDGTRTDIITGLPGNGDYANNKVEFGPDGMLYFGQGTTTNSGVVGTDNEWVRSFPGLCDESGSYIMLNGQNYETNNMLLTPGILEPVYTGAYSAYGVPNIPFEIRKGIVKATGSILRSNRNGTGLELYAWGLRNPVRIKFDEAGRLFAANQGYDNRGSRPIANASDQIYVIERGVWYGWPDYVAGEPVSASRFAPEGGTPAELLVTNVPNMPPVPFAKFPPDSTIMGFDINYYPEFGKRGNFFVAEFGSVWPKFAHYTTPNPGVGHKVSKVDLMTGGVTAFAINKSGFPASLTLEGGFGWPTDVVFGPDHAMYVLDFGTNPRGNLQEFLPNTGVIWRISKI